MEINCAGCQVGGWWLVVLLDEYEVKSGLELHWAILLPEKIALALRETNLWSYWLLLAESDQWEFEGNMGSEYCYHSAIIYKITRKIQERELQCCLLHSIFAKQADDQPRPPNYPRPTSELLQNHFGLLQSYFQNESKITSELFQYYISIEIPHVLCDKGIR